MTRTTLTLTHTRPAVALRPHQHRCPACGDVGACFCAAAEVLRVCGRCRAKNNTSDKET